MNDLDLSTKIAWLSIKNPILLASGTWGFGEHLHRYLDLSILGGLVTKGISITPMMGNPPPRIAETPCGLVNAIGLENPGLKIFKKDILPNLLKYKVPILVNVFGQSIDEYLEVIDGLKDAQIQGVEINISCPNVKRGGLQFGRDPKAVEELVSHIRDIYEGLLVIKISPVGPALEVARAAAKAGADALTVANTYPALVIDIERRRPAVAAGFGGLSGPAIKPLTLRLVYEISNKIDLPIIGSGGISSGRDVIEYLLSGASAVQIGTATLINPYSPKRILTELSHLLGRLKIQKLSSLIGALETQTAGKAD